MSLAFACIARATPAPADTAVGAIAAIAGGHVITTSDVRKRAKPHLARVDAEGTDPVKKARAREAVWREVLDAMIDEQLFADEAARLHVEVSDADVATALANVAKQNGMTEKELLAEAERQGYPQDDYRAQVRAQLLEMKLIMVERSRSERGKDEKKEVWVQRLRNRTRDRLRKERVVEIWGAP